MVAEDICEPRFLLSFTWSPVKSPRVCSDVEVAAMLPFVFSLRSNP